MNKKISKLSLVSRVRRDAKLLWVAPKAFLYSFTFPKDKYVQILPFDPDTKNIGVDLVRKIRAKHRDLQVHFVGSASLGIPGQKDIDLLAECQPKDFHKYLPALIEIFGNDYKRRAKFVEWHITYKGCDVQLMLIDPMHRTFRDIMEVSSLFKEDKALLEKYKQIKIDCNGESLREYKRRRLEFFNQIQPSLQK